MKTLLLIGHDANRAGAQLVLLDLMRRLHAAGQYRLRLLLGAGGPLLTDYESVASVTVWHQPVGLVSMPLADKILFRLGVLPALLRQQEARRQQQLADALQLDKVDLVLVNTVSSSRWFRQITLPAITPVVTFVHELAIAVEIYSQADELHYLLNRTRSLLAVSQATADYYVTKHGVDPAIVQLFTLIDIPEFDHRIAEARALPDPYPALGLPSDAIIIGGCGNAEWRKGCDLFIALARLTLNELDRETHPKTRPVYFVWVGMSPGDYARQLQRDIDKAGLTEQVLLLPPTPDVLRYSTRFDIFALTSREDPYPLVVFEAGLSKVPVLCFSGAGGAPELVGQTGGLVVPYLSVDAMSHALADWIDTPDARKKMGLALNQTIHQRHDPADAMVTLETVFSRLLPRP